MKRSLPQRLVAGIAGVPVNIITRRYSCAGEEQMERQAALLKAPFHYIGCGIRNNF